MRIVLDLQACQSPSRLRGIGRYSLELAMARAPRGHVNAAVVDRVRIGVARHRDHGADPDRLRRAGSLGKHGGLVAAGRRQLPDRR